MRTAAYRLLRWALVRTSIWPLTSIYRLGYRAAQAVVVSVLRRQPGVVAIYARRGMATGNIQPGISDIDMMLVSRYSLAQNPDAYRQYLKLAKLIPILEKNIMCHAADVLQEEYERRAILRHAWNGDVGSLRLLWGDDVVARVRRQSAGAQPEAMSYGLTMAWQLTTRNFLERKLPQEDPLLAVSVAYRSLADLVRGQRQFLDQRPYVDRETALRERAAATPGATGAFLNALCDSARRGYRSAPPALADQSLAFVLDETQSTIRRLASADFGGSGARFSPTVDAPWHECAQPDDVRGHLLKLAALARAEFGARYRGLAAAPTLFHKAPNWAAVVDIDLADASLLKLSTLIREHQLAVSGLTDPVHLYLLAPEGGLSLGHQVHRLRAEPFLLPFVHLDLFQLLTRPEFQVDGSCRPPLPGSQATAALRSVLREALWIATNRSHVPAPQEWARRRPIGDFWWIIQLWLLAESTKRGELHFAVTPEAAARRLRDIGHRLPESLLPLRRITVSAAAQLPEAADFVEELLGEQAEEFRLVLDSWRGRPTISDWRG